MAKDSLSAINQQFVEINQQFSNLNRQYSGTVEQTNDYVDPSYQPYQSLPAQQETTTYDSYGYNQTTGYESQPPASLPTNLQNYGYEQQQFQTTDYEQPAAVQNEQPNYDYWNQQHHQQQQQPEPSQPDQSEAEVCCI